MPQFLAVVHPLIYGNYIEKNYVAFRLYDGDADGVISSLDLNDMIKNLLDRCPMGGVGKFQTKSCSCSLYQEVDHLNQFILRENIFATKKRKKILDFSNFLDSISLSCIVIELQQLLMANFKVEAEKELIEVEKAERKKRALIQAQQSRRDSLSSFGAIDSPLF